MAPLKFIVDAQLVNTAASDCPNDLDGCCYTHSAGNPHGSPVQTHYGRPAGTDPYCHSTRCSLHWRFSSTSNAAGCSSGHAERPQHRCSYRSCNPAGELFHTHCSYIDHFDIDHLDIDRLDGPNGHLYRHDLDLATGPEHWNWRLLELQTVGRMPVNIQKRFYSSKLVSCISTSLPPFWQSPCLIKNCGISRISKRDCGDLTRYRAVSRRLPNSAHGMQ